MEEKGLERRDPLLSMGPEHGIGKDIHPDWDYLEGGACLLLLNHSFQEIATIYLCTLVLTKDWLFILKRRG